LKNKPKQKLSDNLQKLESAKTSEKSNKDKKNPTKIDSYKIWMRYKETNK
jgi:hypothetical protein